MSRTRPAVAIDGPAGAGKTTVTRAVADRLGYVLVGTGSLYRAVALAAERRGVAWDDEAGVGALARELAARDALGFAAAPGGAERVLLDGEDVSRALRAEGIGQGASRVSAMPAVRAALLDLQRAAGVEGGVVLEGRDIGTVVLPDAEAKFFLTASLEVRARRRYDELLRRGEPAELERVRAEVRERDRRDSEREVAPLRQADDAVLIDSSELTVDEVVARIVARVREVERSLG
ncbi:MAG: (d)CMP kinase [Sorangiineae bacterium]|nr:(d)CMP kinase [Polyangiaceae bacterium]MEB2322802.1 (d)CMP kinase [Sorangiineae bacterium]